MKLKFSPVGLPRELLDRPRDRQALEDREHGADQHEQEADDTGVDRGAGRGGGLLLRRGHREPLDRREVVAEHDEAEQPLGFVRRGRVRRGHRGAARDRDREHVVAGVTRGELEVDERRALLRRGLLPAILRHSPGVDGELAERGDRAVLDLLAVDRDEAGLALRPGILDAVMDHALVRIEDVGELQAVVLLAGGPVLGVLDDGLAHEDPEVDIATPIDQQLIRGAPEQRRAEFTERGASVAEHVHLVLR
jgi:hypothetical protein